MKKIWLLVLFIAITISCADGDDCSGRDYSYDIDQVDWICKDTVYDGPDTTVYDDNVFLVFSESAFPALRLEYSIGVIHGGTVGPSGEFEILGDVKLLSEWNECSIKLPPDTTRKWLFKFVNKDKNRIWSWDFLYDRNYAGDSLVFWDTTNNIKYGFRKHVGEGC